VKSQLHSCISRHLEILRSREVWLLEQIDLVEQLKAETLHQQLQQLHLVSVACQVIFVYGALFAMYIVPKRLYSDNKVTKMALWQL